MTEQTGKQLAAITALCILGYLTMRPQKSVRYTKGSGTMTATELAENYKELVSSPIRMFVNPTNETEPETGTPWAVDLAHYTTNYEAVKSQYLKYYAADLSEDLIAWFRPPELSEYVDALWTINKQVMS